jgi:hypothetical protein
MFSRRQFLLGGASLGLIAALPSCMQTGAGQWLISACDDGKGQHFVAAFDDTGKIISKTALPARGHGVLAHPTKPGHGLIVARRPGYFAMEINFANGGIVAQITPEMDQHFFGHALFSADGKVLITTENQINSGRGLIVLRDSNTYKILDKFDSGGIGPHEAVQMPGSKTLVVANGGILTHPDTPRKKLNLDTMQPNLSYIDMLSGKILAQYELDNSKLGIRHLAVSQQGKVIGGLQYQGAKTDQVPLAFSHKGKGPMQYLKATDEVWQQMNQYTASICVNDANNTVAISCPRADKVTFWDLETDEFINSIKLIDGAGLALYQSSSQSHIVATNGKGQAIFQGVGQLAFDNIRWDNHLVAVRAV